MTNITFRRPVTLLALGAITLFAVLPHGDAEARERVAGRARADAPPRVLTHPRPHPRAGATRTTQTQRTDGGFQRTTTITNGAGQTATRNVEVVRDRAAGTMTRSVDYTTFDGRSASIDTTRTRTDDGFRSVTTGTRPNGESYSRTIERVCDRDARQCRATVERDGGAANGGNN